MVSVRVAVFDLGGVLIDWNPRYLYRKLLPDEEAIEDFLARVCTQAWNERQDAGRSVAEATAALVAEHPQHAELICAYYDRFDEMMAGPIEETVEVLDELHRRGVPLYALSNFSAETFRLARRRFDFLSRFHAILLSSEEALIKPDPRFYRLLFERHAIEPTHAVFIDDNAANVETARSLGMAAIQFRRGGSLRGELGRLGLL